ncbi:hypothetical protein R3P38DRAFT_2981450 [Favolaschia claudopus]|uniref:F-box domain-containing protein n=1 Tax=Favolaschia claudopus TaxID=2862362 RepID=A0AAW0AXY5_9AGAR
MHRCLQILEILQLICENIDYGIDLEAPSATDQSASTLAALSRSCRIWMGPALASLWEHQSSLDPFLRLLPTNLLEPPAFGNSRQWRLLRPVIATDWDRANVYAPWVKRFALTRASWVRVSNIFPILSACSPLAFIFPCLRSFTCLHPAMPELPNIASLRTFFPPSLHRLWFSCGRNSTAASLLSTLPNSCPNVKYLTISWTPASGASSHTVPLFLSGLRSLVKLSMEDGECNSLILMHLGQLSTLTDMQLYSVSNDMSSLQFTSSPLFPHLRNLSISVVEIWSATALMEHCSNASLISLALDFSSNPTTVAIQQLYDVLTRTCGHKTLQSLILRSVRAGSSHADQERYRVTKSLLHKLTVFRALKTLTISAMTLSLADDTFADLTSFWPDLEHLRLIAMDVAIGRAEPQMTLRSVASLAKNCSRMLSLTLQVNGTEMPPSGPVRICGVDLSYWHVGFSPISEAIPVARYLSALFPRLKKIDTGYREVSEEERDHLAHERNRLWREVVTQIPHFVAARQEEQGWGPL